MVIWALPGVLALVVAGLTGYIAWRDSRRSATAERVVIHTALPSANRYGSERHLDQGGP
jgi:hypothetical protein